MSDDRMFTMGMVVEVAEVIEAQGYNVLSDRELVELQQHLFHFLHGRGRGDDHCTGDVR
jgi:hypothetical protein